MRPDDVLDMIGDARGEYIWDAQQVRSGEISVRIRRLSAGKLWLIAALIGLMLLLVGCTIAYVNGWFADYFAEQSEKPLSDSQVALIEKTEQKINEGQTQNGWTVELRSAMKDHNKAYIIIGITAPEGIDLEPEVVDGVLTEQFSPGNNRLASDEEDPPELIIYPKGVVPSSMTMRWAEDGDGLDNTKNYVIELEPNLTESSVDPFGPEAQWKIHIEDIVRTYDDEEYKQELLNTKYKGDYGVMFTHEETQRIKQREVLVEGVWDFAFTFTEPDQSLQQLELLHAPIQTAAEIPRRYGEELWEVVDVRENIAVTSILLQPLSAKVTYAPCDGVPNFYFDDGDIDRSNNVYAYCVLKDGSRITLQDWGSGGDGYKLLEAESPIVLEEADYILLPDGTRVCADGTVKYAQAPALPAAAQEYHGVSSNTGVYAYFADFDGDMIDDMALWYDGAFHALCLLTETGEAAKTFSFEAGMDIYETYNQRAEEIKHEPNQISVSETVGEGTNLRFFRAAEDGLHLSVGIRYDPSAGESWWFQSMADPSVPYDAALETWEPITEDAYRRIVEDFQVMCYRLIPIQ